MRNIDQLQRNVYNLRRQRASGNPAGNEEKQLQESLTGLEVHYTTYSKQLEGAPDGVPVSREHLDFLQSYAWNALQDARSVASSMELETLPLHTDILTPSERESFAEDLAILNSLLQGKAGQLAPEDVQTLVETASRLGEHNSRCKDALNTLSHPEHDNDSVHLKRWNDSIDRFQSALEHAVEKAIGTEPPAPPVAQQETVTTPGIEEEEEDDDDLYSPPPHLKQTSQRALEHAVDKAIGTEPPAPPVAEPETIAEPEMTTQEKVDQSLGEMRKYLDLSKGRLLTDDELEIVHEHFHNVHGLTKLSSLTYVTDRANAGNILKEIESSHKNSDGLETTSDERVERVKKLVRKVQRIVNEGSQGEHSVAKSMPYDAGKQEAWKTKSTASSPAKDEDDDALSIYTDANEWKDDDDDDKRASR